MKPWRLRCPDFFSVMWIKISTITGSYKSQTATWSFHETLFPGWKISTSSKYLHASFNLLVTQAFHKNVESLHIEILIFSDLTKHLQSRRFVMSKEILMCNKIHFYLLSYSLSLNLNNYQPTNEQASSKKVTLLNTYWILLKWISLFSLFR